MFAPVVGCVGLFKVLIIAIGASIIYDCAVLVHLSLVKALGQYGDNARIHALIA